MTHTEKMSPVEVRASISLASIYGLRMLGMFLILPVFAIYAEHLPGGQNHTLIGFALGAYGLTQALLQLPFGMASDRFGRKRVIYFGLLLFAIGSFVAASASDLYMIIIGRSIQGAGAISAAVTALTADLTREEHRTKAMAMIGMTIGITFALSLILGPAFYHLIGMPGIFAMTGGLALLAILVVKYAVPNPQISRFHSDAEAMPSKLKDVLRDKQLLRLNYGIFVVHAAQMAMFMVVPFALKETGGIDANHHWQIYLPVMIVSFLIMIPVIIYGEKNARLKPVFVGAIGLMLLAQVGFVFLIHNFWGVVMMLVTYFIAFNVLEASLPSLISKIAPAASKGTAMGVYNTFQSLGLFLGGTMGGYLSHRFGYSAVFVFGGGLTAIWLVFALGMTAPPAVKSRMFHIGEMSVENASKLAQKLADLKGVVEAVVLSEEGVAYLKVDMKHWDEQGVNELIARAN
ncbi:MFS transporter [Sulfurirhabdus autotrophica]|uniref:Putative MFS family arabinose efflux permease n=1 Tax=Sulfurirhabdus autotrophica TaxID=1706046 RepID=A0A4R3XXM2_9PROT|nr:MFS transporter [Sulfurirhabdus autotrophica]TCV83777.1 putative MFS family arabinose efflux permease [Sulfurirhabdus autotrophica]